jgi:uncharacterized protein YjbI with pentapeptide repeats/deoxyadenosine/deoxycytidine kinase
MAWTAKIFSERVIRILNELEFYDFKKISKNVFKAQLKLGKIEVPFVINIFYSRKKVIQEEEIKMFFADINMTKGFVKGIFIGYPEFNKKARETGEKLDIITLDLYELLNSLSDTTEYRKWLRNLSKIKLKNYIPHKLSNKETFLEFDSLLHMVEQDSGKPIFIEGEIGIGKSTLLKSILAELGKKSALDIKNKIPFYVDLKQYSSYSSLEDFLFQEVFRKNGIKLRSIESFEILCKENRLIFLLDNFDRVGVPESEEILGLGKQLKKLVDMGVSIVATAPPGYFGVDFKNKFYYTKFLREVFLDIAPQLYKIENFTLGQIKQRLTNPKLQRLISRNEFLKEVCKIPVFLDIFSNLKIEQEEELEKFSDIYRESIKQWNSEYLTSMGKEMLAEEMAQSVFEKGEFELKRDIPEYMENFIHNRYKAMPFSLELVRKDIEKAFFIRKLDNDKYEFIHSSFVYFFIAKRLIEEIRKGNYNHIWLLSSSLILKFVEDAMGQDKIFNVIIERYNREKFSKEKGEVLFLMYKVAETLDVLKEIPINRISTQKIEAENKMLVNLNLTDVDFKESDFRNSDFRFSKSSKIDFSNCILENANLSFSDFKRSTFNSANMKYIMSKNSSFSESSFYKTNLFQSQCLKTDFSKCHFNSTNFHGVLAVEANFKKSDFRGVELSNGDFTKSDFEEASLEGFKCRSGLFYDSNFRYSHLKDIEFPFSIFHGTDFTESQLFNVDFSALNMKDSSFEKANLHNVSFKNSDLRKVSFKDSVLKEVDFSGCDLRGTDMTGAQMCDRTKESMKESIYSEVL